MINFVHCSKCGKQVSNAIDVDHELFIRAWIECPECIDKQSAIDSRLKEAVEEINEYVLLQNMEKYEVDRRQIKRIFEKHFPELKENKNANL